MKKFIITFVLILGGIAFYFLWSKPVDLPRIGTVKDWPLIEVGTEEEKFVPQDKPKLVTFFFTNCPDICPMTMWDLKDLHQEMQERGISNDQYNILSITLDPEYDTDERIIKYKDTFDISTANWLFLRSSEAELREFTKHFNFMYAKDERGFVTHSTSMYLVDAKGQIRTQHDMAVGDRRVNIEEIANHLELLINKKMKSS